MRTNHIGRDFATSHQIEYDINNIISKLATIEEALPNWNIVWQDVRQ